MIIVTHRKLLFRSLSTAHCCYEGHNMCYCFSYDIHVNEKRKKG